MSPDPGYENGDQCAAAGEFPDSAGMFCRDQFMEKLSGMLGQGVEIVPMHLPEVCACLWLGCTGLDRIGFNPDWPGHDLTLTAHAIGHLVLGHCGPVRDGGQFACLPAHAGLTDRDHDHLRRFVNDPVERLSRLFSDREEKAAETFAARLGDRLGLPGGQHPAGTSRHGDGFNCIG
ncbi:MAG TPA: hypothetical protein VN969_42780 [Streptosporangiaceae bacterium]|nr:hypothetical protein [Streptosporangiaceae bacterium]